MVTPQTWMAGGGPGRDVTSRVMQRVGGRGNVCAGWQRGLATTSRMNGEPGRKAEVSPVYGALLGSPAIYRRAVVRARRMAIYRRAVARARRMAIYRRAVARAENGDLSPGGCVGARMAIYRRAVRDSPGSAGAKNGDLSPGGCVGTQNAIYCGMASPGVRMAIYRRAAGVQRPEAQSPDQAVSLTSPQRCFLNGKPAYAARRLHGRIALVINS